MDGGECNRIALSITYDNMDNKPYKYQYDLDVGSVMVRDTGEHARSPPPV